MATSLVNTKISKGGRVRNFFARFSSAYRDFISRKGIRRFTDFCYSPLFVYALGVITLALTIAGIDELTYSFLALVASAVLVFCPDALPLLAVGVFYTVARSKGGRANASDSTYVDFTTASRVITDIAMALVALSGALHAVVNFKAAELRSGRLLPGFVFVAVALVSNGLFAPDYSWGYPAMGLKIAVFVTMPYICARVFIRPTREVTRYFAYVCLVHGLMIGIQLCLAYLSNKAFAESNFSKDLLYLGWGKSNAIGEALFRSIPFCFYLMCTEEKHVWYYFAVAVLLIVAQWFTFARASVLVTLPVAAISYALCCVFGKRRKQIILCGIAFLTVLGLSLIGVREWLGQMFAFFKDNGLADHGRFRLWDIGTEAIADYPVFGTGFRYLHDIIGTNFYYYHNTVVQFYAACGAAGIIAYLANRMQIFALYTVKPTAERAFYALLLAGILAISLLDCFYMLLPTQLFVGFALSSSERDLERKGGLLYGRRLPRPRKFRLFPW